MKPSLIRLFIVAVILSIIFFGSISPDKARDSKMSQFGFFHSSVLLPDFKKDRQECRSGSENNILVPPPDKFHLADFEKELYDFILNRKYDTEGKWCVDKRVRNTGLFSKGTYYGVHPAVRMYYSPRMMYWLTGNPDYWVEGKKRGEAKLKKPREGKVPDGAMIVKEMYFPPAEIYLELEKLIESNSECDQEDVYERLLSKLISSWTVMVKADANSKDGWFWANPGAVQPSDASVAASVKRQLDDYSHMQYSSFGQPTCLRCHGSAENEYTFSALRNVEGTYRLNKNGVYEYCADCPEENLVGFYTDESWREDNYIDRPGSSFLAKLFAIDEPCLDSSVVKKMFELSHYLVPWEDRREMDPADFYNPHLRGVEEALAEVQADRLPSINPAFATAFSSILNTSDIKRFPSQWADHVVADAKKTSHYITSDNCLGCHGGLGGAPPDVTMFVKTGPEYGDGYNLSEYGEWRWSPMGLAGRDPIFYAQLESEMAYLARDSMLTGSAKANQEQVTSTCLSCHGAMGQRQLKLDAKTDKSLDPLFKVDYVYLTDPLSAKDKDPVADKYHKYGELAREGISCTVCHHINEPNFKDVQKWSADNKWLAAGDSDEDKKLAYMLFHNTTGQYVRGPANELNGPFSDVKVAPMQQVLGITPKQNDYIRNSQMCGSCHTINLPNIGQKVNANNILNQSEKNPAFQSYNHTIEQATFLEWQNSAFAQPKFFKSCQDCHMPGGFKSLDGSIEIDQVVTKIATIQDNTYPEVEHELPHKDIEIPLRDNYRRHEHVGLNVFLLEMFDQFPDVLGVDHMDEMTYAKNGNQLAIENMIRQAREATIDLDFEVVEFKKGMMTVEVRVKNKTGHRFPSGVSFRRAFLEFLVMEGDDVIWGSGRTNSVGVIVDEKGRPLKTEFLDEPSGDSILYQHHHQVITRQDQVQIYEELNQNGNDKFTTSFIHRVHPVKDNRLLPMGWQPASYFKPQGELFFQYMKATDPEGVEGDPDYEGQGPGFPGEDKLIYRVKFPREIDPSSLSVQVSMNYQSIPPYFLNQRFKAAPNGDATRRLYYMTSHLNLDGTAMEGWKLPLVKKQMKYSPKKRAWLEE
jgi:hypothetical protein